MQTCAEYTPAVRDYHARVLGKPGSPCAEPLGECYDVTVDNGIAPAYSTPHCRCEAGTFPMFESSDYFLAPYRLDEGCRHRLGGIEPTITSTDVKALLFKSAYHAEA